MADNIAVTPGSGATVAADDIGGVLVQRVKLQIGADGSADDIARPIAPFRFDLANAVGSTAWYNSTGSSTANTRPAFKAAGRSQFRVQGIELTGGGYNNAGTTTTAGNITNYTERFDTGQASPAHGVALEDLTTVTQATVGQYGTLACALAVAKTNHGGVRGFVPVSGYVAPQRHRFGAGRRLG